MTENTEGLELPLMEETLFTQFVDDFMVKFQGLVREGYSYVPNTARLSTTYKTATLIRPTKGFEYKYEEFEEDEDLAELKKASIEGSSYLGVPDWGLVKTFTTKDELFEYGKKFNVKLRKNQKVENMINQFIEDYK